MLVLMLFAQQALAQGSHLEWKSGNRLSWGNYRGAAPDGDSRPAYTHCFIKYSMKVDPNDYGSMKMEALTWEIRTLFDPSESWKGKGANAGQLAHEQGHFDLAEIYARKFSKWFASVKKPGKATYKEAARMFKEIVNELKKELSRYDKETDHGADADAQKEWKKRLARELKKGKKYAAN